MSIESVPQLPNPEINTESPPHLYWFSGLTGTTASGEMIIPELEAAMRAINSSAGTSNTDEQPSRVTYLHSLDLEKKQTLIQDLPKIDISNTQMRYLSV